MKKKVLSAVALSLAAGLFLTPLAAVMGASFWAGGKATLQNYDDLLFDCFNFYPMFWNSLSYAAVILAVQLVVVVPCAFGFSHAKFRGKSLLFVFYIVLMMMPLQVTILPNYIGLREMGLLDTRWAIIIPAVFSPFGVVVMRQYMRGSDGLAVEAMRLETNSIILIMIHAVIPQIKICIFAVALFVFADNWNMMEQPLLFLESEHLKTLPVFMATAGDNISSALFPAAVIYMIPALLLYGFFSGSLEKGLTFGDLK
ncbi:MAG: carbohydrate ABC transporter permease [Oscillospiraceae bacterium]|nr:carbohydrate ABC transporter permease [Oscillospiraceae bacterium]